ncbi:MAG: hypothetical protein C4576_30920 [Desulfobacteraceae bacterium]|nr:MAG: hypothetical protein C4576_30920 [Desulfobacteraceae bacterium]
MKLVESHKKRSAIPEHPPPARRRREEFSAIEYLLAPGRHNALEELLLEKERALGLINAKDFGPRVTDTETARQFLSRVSVCTRDILGLSAPDRPDPEIVLRHNLSRLPRQTMKSYFFFSTLCLILGAATISQDFRLPYNLILFSALGVLLVIPMLVHRRTRLHLEHQCHYARTVDGEGAIVVDELHSIQLQSYIAHEYGHHLISSLRDPPKEAWIREGWSRLLQWRVVSMLARVEGDPAFLHHALFQIVSELKFVCMLVAHLQNRKLPSKIRRIPTLYHFNPLYNLITGTPGVHNGRLLVHALGTAVFFLESRERGIDAVLSDMPLVPSMRKQHEQRFFGLSRQ